MTEPEPGMVTLTIDGKTVQAKAGTNLIEAANSVDVHIPFYCYHQRLSIAANCRMCLVKVSNAPKLVPACQTQVSEGLKVTTDNAEVMDSHRSVQEFLLYNHPVDCAICDQAGECKLQDYYMEFDHKPYRPTQPKVLRHKRKELGPKVVLDQERCILCTRCVRFMREIPKAPQIGVFGRGNREYIDIFPGLPLDSKYAGNTVDICPVGALLSTEFRFKARAFFLSTTPSICTGCSRGCNTFLDWFDDTSYRYRPRENEAVNQAWMCDDGRATIHKLNENRVLEATLGRGADAKVQPLADALRIAAEKLGPVAGTPGLAALVSPQLSVEDLLAVCRLVKDGLKLTEIFEGGLPDGDQDEILIRADKNPNRRGLAWVAAAFGLRVSRFQSLTDGIAGGQIKALYAAGLKVPLPGEQAAQAFRRLELSIGQAVHRDALSGTMDVCLPVAPHSESDGLFVNFQGRAQRFQQAYPSGGASQAHWRLAEGLFHGLGYSTPFHASARDLFQDLGARVPELREVRWDDLGPNAARLPGIALTPAAADGRPEGYRERVVSLPVTDGLTKPTWRKA